MLSILSIPALIPIIIFLIIFVSKDANDEMFKNIKIISILGALFNFIFSTYIWSIFDKISNEYQFVLKYSLFDKFNLSFSLGLDSLSLIFIILTNFLFIVVFLFVDVKKYSKNYFLMLQMLHLAILLTLMSTDIIVFYTFFELSVFFIFFAMNKGAIKSDYAKFKFLIFNVGGSFLMFLSIVYIVFKTGDSSLKAIAAYSNFTVAEESLLWLGLFLAFSIKSGMFPFHIWVSDTYKNTSNELNIILSGILIKFGIYGFLKIVIPVFIVSSIKYSFYVDIFALITTFYCLFIAFTKTNIKSFLAYFSLAHMGMIIFGVFALNAQGMEGAILQSFSHAIFMGGLFTLLILIEKRAPLVTKFDDISGLIYKMPILCIFLFIFCLAGFSVPGTNTFVGEFLILFSNFNHYPIFTGIFTLSIVFSAALMLLFYKKIVYGDVNNNILAITDLTALEIIVCLVFAAIIILMGIFPQIFLDLINSYVYNTVDIMKSKLIIK